MKPLLALAVAQTGLLLQVVRDDFGTGIPEQGRWGWLVLGSLLLWIGVARLRSRLARAALIVGAFTGTILYAVNLAEGLPNAWWFVVAYALQAVPLLTPPARAYLWSSGAEPTRS